MARTARRAADIATAADVLAVAVPVRRAVERRLAGGPAGPEVDDVVQETLARLWAARWRLERATLRPYALTVARNLITSAERGRALRERHTARLAEPARPEDPAVTVVAAEERAALAAAVAALREDDRRLLIEHEVHGTPATEIAERRGLPAGTVAGRLARARARLRVEHLLALGRVELPTARCRGVLDAISLGDRRRQRALLASEHLAGCPTCTGLAGPLATRRRSLAGVTPLPARRAARPPVAPPVPVRRSAAG